MSVLIERSRKVNRLRDVLLKRCKNKIGVLEQSVAHRLNKVKKVDETQIGRHRRVQWNWERFNKGQRFNRNDFLHIRTPDDRMCARCRVDLSTIAGNGHKKC